LVSLPENSSNQPPHRWSGVSIELGQQSAVEMEKQASSPQANNSDEDGIP